MNEQEPLPVWQSVRAEVKCAARTVTLLAQGRIHLPKDHVGRWLRFEDNTSSRVYRERSWTGSLLRIPRS